MNKKLFFVTGNDGKFKEAQQLIPYLEQVKIDLPEEQELDPETIIAKKLEVALKHVDGSCIVEDTSLYLEGMNGFPGPLIKWLRKSLGNKGIYELAQKMQNNRAVAKTVIGYIDKNGQQHFFDGSINGKIVAPEGIDGFGWDDIFQPDGLNETFAEMGDEFKPEFSMRTQAFQKLKDFLDKTTNF